MAMSRLEEVGNDPAQRLQIVGLNLPSHCHLPLFLQKFYMCQAH